MSFSVVFCIDVHLFSFVCSALCTEHAHSCSIHFESMLAEFVKSTKSTSQDPIRWLEHTIHVLTMCHSLKTFIPPILSNYKDNTWLKEVMFWGIKFSLTLSLGIRARKHRNSLHMKKRAFTLSTEYASLIIRVSERVGNDHKTILYGKIIYYMKIVWLWPL